MKTTYFMLYHNTDTLSEFVVQIAIYTSTSNIQLHVLLHWCIPASVVAYYPQVHQGTFGPDCPTPQRRFGVYLSEWLVGQVVRYIQSIGLQTECWTNAHMSTTICSRNSVSTAKLYLLRQNSVPIKIPQDARWRQSQRIAENFIHAQYRNSAASGTRIESKIR